MTLVRTGFTENRNRAENPTDFEYTKLPMVAGQKKTKKEKEKKESCPYMILSVNVEIDTNS